ncbi:unnamed protein product [Bursaphelenchus okinawaensis]|uniref:CHK kinase-like domain-containing protein n=1 Tax=Bursaphelenchus okinawaensis TaxID=465554 RepID=A0A811KZX5_9BILA|nr:unnamed protein product [Bursaphelenchus okinawaensis]CAG9113690.1 unnamed protein product [Bursaphelenchus okinawaensis]
MNMKLEDELENSGFSIGWVLRKLNGYCDDYLLRKGSKQVVNIEARDVADGKGYLSSVFITTVTFDDKSKFTFAIKVPTFERVFKIIEDMEGTTEDSKEGLKDKVKAAHNIECDAIAFVSSCKDFPSPKVYYVEKSGQDMECGLQDKVSPGVIIMSALDGISLGGYVTVTKEQCLNFARDFATLHDFVATVPYNVWGGKFDNRIHWDPLMFENAKACLNIFVEEYPDVANICAKLKTVNWPKYVDYALHERPAELHAKTYVHGDVWANNIMYKKNSDGSVGDEVLAYIDYQCGFEGNPMFDFARFFSINADAEVRREVYKAALKVYYERLTELYAQRGAKVPYDLEAVEEMYELAFMQQSTQSASMVLSLNKEHNGDMADGVAEARSAKALLRVHFILLDAEKIWQKRNFDDLPIFD